MMHAKYDVERYIEWNKKCPKCYSPIVWSMANISAGSTASARCSKSIFGSVIVSSIDEIKICNWTGKAIRQKDGSVRIKDLNDEWLREIHFIKKI